MAKKTVDSLTTTTTTTTPPPQKTSQTRAEIKVAINCAMRFFWDLADLIWANAAAHQLRLAGRMPLITVAYIAAQVADVAVVKALPDKATRSANKKRARKSLAAYRQAVMTEVNTLETAINMAYKQQAELIPVELAAGITALRAATPRDYPAVSTFLTASANYLTENGAKLVDAQAITADFASDLETLGEDYNAAKTAYTNEKQKADDGKDAVDKGILRLKEAMSIVLEVGKNVFEFEPELRKLFTAEHVLDQVRSTHPANLVGRTDLGPVVEGFKPKPLAGILVEVLNQPGKTSTTDKKGRYKIPIAGGQYMVRYSGMGMEPVELQVTIAPGKDRRINRVLLPMEVAVPETETPLSREITPPASMNETLAKAMQHVDTPTMNGEPASQNGHAV